MNLDLSHLHDNPWQVREVYDPAYLEELAADIQQNGLLQPPLARLNGDGYQLAFGHCRLRAYKLLHQQDVPGFENMPVDVRPLTDEQMADFAWTENEKRRDVTPIERMHAIKKQMETFGWTQAQVAERRGISEATVSNILRLGQLPEDIQAKVHEGELSERAALPLLTYYSLPEPVRHAASSKKWLDNPVKFASEGRSSDDIRGAVKNVIFQTAVALDNTLLEQAFEGEAYLAPTCLNCPNHFEYNKAHYCGEQTWNCLSAKRNVGRQALLAKAEAMTGIPVLPEGENYRAFYGIIGYGDTHLASLHPTEDHPGILAQGCEHLRLRLDSTAEPIESLADPKFHHNIGVVCCNPSRACTCAQAMHLARQPHETTTPEEQARLQERQAEQIRLQQNAESFRHTFLEPTIQTLLTMAQGNDVRFWQFLAFKLVSQGWEDVRTWSLAQCQEKIAAYLAWTRISIYETQSRPEDALKNLNVTRARLGLAPLTMPEDPNATPSEKLLHRLERIESWLERWADGELDPTPEAVEGNLANLDHLKREYAALPESDEDQAFFIRVNAHIESLTAWLNEAGDEEEEEDLDASILQAYIGEATPA